MNIGNAQQDMRNAYLSGGTGVLISGLVWMTAGIVGIFYSVQTSFLIFFFGGMLIFPLSILVAKLFNRSGKHRKENPLGKLGMESTVILFIGLFITYLLLQNQPTWVFPFMLMIIGARYLVFQTIYGLKVYWMLGLLLIVAGFTGLILNPPFYTCGIIGGILEFIFSAIIILKYSNT